MVVSILCSRLQSVCQGWPWAWYRHIFQAVLLRIFPQYYEALRNSHTWDLSTKKHDVNTQNSQIHWKKHTMFSWYFNWNIIQPTFIGVMCCVLIINILSSSGSYQFTWSFERMPVHEEVARAQRWTPIEQFLAFGVWFSIFTFDSFYWRAVRTKGVRGGQFRSSFCYFSIRKDEIIEFLIVTISYQKV